MKKERFKRGYLLALPLGLGIAVSVKDSAVWIILFIISVFAVVPAIPAFRHRENLGISLVVAVCSVPVNIKLSLFCIRNFFYLNLFGEILYFILCMVIFWSVEEIIAGIAARLIWRRQYKCSFSDSSETEDTEQ